MGVATECFPRKAMRHPVPLCELIKLRLTMKKLPPDTVKRELRVERIF